MATVTERYAAVVTKIEEDAKVGRIFVKCFQLTGDEDTEYPDAIDPVFDWGWFYIPDIGEEVEVEVVAKDDQEEATFGQAFIDEPRIRWRNKRFRSDEGDEPRPPDPVFTSKNYGKRRGFATPKGHVLMFDDTDGDEAVFLSWTDGSKVSCMEIDKTGTLTINITGGIVLKMDQDQNVSLTCKDLKMDADTSTLIKGAADAMVMGTTWAAARSTKNTAVAAGHNAVGLHLTPLGPLAATLAGALAAPPLSIPPLLPLSSALAPFFAAFAATAGTSGAASTAAKAGIDTFEGDKASYLSTKAKVGT